MNEILFQPERLGWLLNALEESQMLKGMGFFEENTHDKQCEFCFETLSPEPIVTIPFCAKFYQKFWDSHESTSLKSMLWLGTSDYKNGDESHRRPPKISRQQKQVQKTGPKSPCKKISGEKKNKRRCYLRTISPQPNPPKR